MPPPQSDLPTEHTLASAITVFAQGWPVTRSFTHPFAGHRVGPLWVLRDAPRKNPKDYRREEWVACDLNPVRVHRLVQKHHRKPFAICAIAPVGGNVKALRAGYKDLGYRFGGTEAFMVHDLKRIPRRTSPATITRIKTRKQLEALNQSAPWTQIKPGHLVPDAPVRSYIAQRDGEVVGWVSSIRTPSGHWCNSMFVSPRHRRQGIGSALLTRMLRDDRQGGASCNVLTASIAGAKLYATVGYRLIGSLLLFTPKRA